MHELIGIGYLCPRILVWRIRLTFERGGCSLLWFPSLVGWGFVGCIFVFGPWVLLPLVPFVALVGFLSCC